MFWAELSYFRPGVWNAPAASRLNLSVEAAGVRAAGKQDPAARHEHKSRLRPGDLVL